MYIYIYKIGNLVWSLDTKKCTEFEQIRYKGVEVGGWVFERARLILL